MAIHEECGVFGMISYKERKYCKLTAYYGLMRFSTEDRKAVVL